MRLLSMLLLSFALPALASAQAPPADDGAPPAAKPAEEAKGDTRLILKVHGIKSDQGKVHALLFTEERGFPLMDYQATRKDVPAKEGTVELVFEGLKPGQVAAIVYHDLDGDGTPNRNALFGSYGEPHQYTRNARHPLGVEPAFFSAAVELKEGMFATVEIQMQDP